MISFSRAGGPQEGTYVVPADGSGDPQLIVADGYSPAWERLLPADLLQGDIDCDGDVDAVDGAHLVAFAAEVPFDHEGGCPSVGALAASFFRDVDCYGTVDLLDALAVFRYLAGVLVNQNELCPAINTPLAP